MTPQKKIRVGAGFVAIWVLLGGAWLCDYFFGDTEFWKLASGELTVLLGIGAGTAMIREGRRGQVNINSIILPIVLYMARYQQLIVSCHFLEWKLSFPGEGTGVPFNGNDRSF